MELMKADFALPTGSPNDDGKFDNGKEVSEQFGTWRSSSKREPFDSLPFNEPEAPANSETMMQ